MNMGLGMCKCGCPTILMGWVDIQVDSRGFYARGVCTWLQGLYPHEFVEVDPVWVLENGVAVGVCCL